jgi:type IV pilus assembly protein PilW
MADPVEYVLKSVDPPNVLNVGSPLGRFTGGQVFNGLQEIIYQVNDTPVLGLYKCQDNTPDGQCNDPSQVNTPFIDGVESMQVRYGIERNGTIQFKDTPTTQSNERVIAVRITLLMRTPQKRGIPGTTDKDFYLDPGVTYNPQNNFGEEEGFRHRLFTTTIQVRNSTI